MIKAIVNETRQAYEPSLAELRLGAPLISKQHFDLLTLLLQ